MSAAIIDLVGARRDKAEVVEIAQAIAMANSVTTKMRADAAAIELVMATPEWRFTDRAGAINTLESAIRAIKGDRASIAAKFARCAARYLERIESDGVTIEKDLATAKRRARARRGAQTREHNKKAREPTAPT